MRGEGNCQISDHTVPVFLSKRLVYEASLVYEACTRLVRPTVYCSHSCIYYLYNTAVCRVVYRALANDDMHMGEYIVQGE